MIASMLRLTRWELFKFRKRWIPWILLGLVVIITQLSLWGVYFSYGNVDEADFRVYHGPPDAGGLLAVTEFSCVDIDDAKVASAMARVPEEDRERVLTEIERRREYCPEHIEEVTRERQRLRQFFVLPGSLSTGLAVASTFGIIFSIILAGSTMGVEYGWGTLRSALTKGIGRWQFLGAKALSLLLLGGAGFLVVSLAIVVSSLIATSFISDEGGGLAASGEWSATATLFGKTVYGLIPYVILTLFLSVLTSSSSMGIAAAMAYYFAELILIGILTNVFDWFHNVSDFLLGPSIIAWMTEPGVQATGGGSALFTLSDLPSQLQAFLVVTAHIVITGAAALWLFQRKDIGGARGE